jgi:hypothetical protein
MQECTKNIEISYGTLPTHTQTHTPEYPYSVHFIRIKHALLQGINT